MAKVNEMAALPDFLIAGAEKAGTTWVHSRLSQHPQLFLPETKELHFFNAFNSNFLPNACYESQGLSWYSKFFESAAKDQIKGEATPMYLCDPAAPQRIKAALPACKLIFILRNPVDRAYSHYWMAARKGHTSKSFEEVVLARDPRFIGRGLYADQLRTYYELFGREQIKVLFFESLIQNPQEELSDLLKFLGAPDFSWSSEKTMDGGFETNAAARPRFKWLQDLGRRTAKALWQSQLRPLMQFLKSSGATRWVRQMNNVREDYPAMSPELRKQLAAYYESQTIALEKALGVDLSAWRES